MAIENRYSPALNKSAVMAENKIKRIGPITFLRQVQVEGKKVTWTSRGETVSATIMVLIMSVLVSIFLFFGDMAWGAIVRLITGLGS